MVSRKTTLLYSHECFAGCCCCCSYRTCPRNRSSPRALYTVLTLSFATVRHDSRRRRRPARVSEMSGAGGGRPREEEEPPADRRTRGRTDADGRLIKTCLVFVPSFSSEAFCNLFTATWSLAAAAAAVCKSRLITCEKSHVSPSTPFLPPSSLLPDR